MIIEIVYPGKCKDCVYFTKGSRRVKSKCAVKETREDGKAVTVKTPACKDFKI